MSFQPNPNDELTIGGETYRVAEHPAAPGIAHGQEGQAGIVYRLLPLSLWQGYDGDSIEATGSSR